MNYNSPSTAYAPIHGGFPGVTEEQDPWQGHALGDRCNCGGQVGLNGHAPVRCTPAATVAVEEALESKSAPVTPDNCPRCQSVFASEVAR